MHAPIRRNRKSIRLEGYDYSTNGAYFITICSHKKKRTFSEIANGEVKLSSLGLIIQDEWEKTTGLRGYATTSTHVIMPDHFHGILFIHPSSNEPEHLSQTGCHLYFPEGYCNRFGPQRRNLSSIVRGFKSAVTQRARISGLTGPIWQRNFYEHIVRNEYELSRIADYIDNNPFAWDETEEPPGQQLRNEMKNAA